MPRTTLEGRTGGPRAKADTPTVRAHGETRAVEEEGVYSLFRRGTSVARALPKQEEVRGPRLGIGLGLLLGYPVSCWAGLAPLEWLREEHRKETGTEPAFGSLC